MSEGTKVFNPQVEIANLKKDIEDLKQQVAALSRQVAPTVAIAGWPVDSFPKGYDGFPVKYSLGLGVESCGFDEEIK